MNNNFSFKRFCQVVAKDWGLYLQKFGIALIVWISIPVMLWITTLVFGYNMDGIYRSSFIISFIAGTVMTVPAIVYGNTNLPREGVRFAMLPATSSEKFLSMVLYCSVVTPLLCCIGCLLVDTLLTLLPFGGFKEFIAIADTDHVGLLILLLTVIFFTESSLFMLGNMIFQKRKTGKTFAWILLILFVLMLVIQIPFILDGVGTLIEVISDSEAALWFHMGFLLLITTVLNLLTYRRIKNQKY